jgi:hypothetical protein
MSDLSFRCELCGDPINSGDRTIRVAAEMCTSDGLGGGTKRPDDEEVIFAVFHAKCVLETYASRDCDVVPYVIEAREVLSESESP